mmetsp:Transcript_9196/g.16329  ORF Transcript_9196/g.16329 Transcript_9196/m.16329 type:complete len:261 (+) Transcript_9196:1792-2574(+)
MCQGFVALLPEDAAPHFVRQLKDANQLPPRVADGERQQVPGLRAQWAVDGLDREPSLRVVHCHVEGRATAERHPQQTRGGGHLDLLQRLGHCADCLQDVGGLAVQVHHRPLRLRPRGQRLQRQVQPTRQMAVSPIQGLHPLLSLLPRPQLLPLRMLADGVLGVVHICEVLLVSERVEGFCNRLVGFSLQQALLLLLVLDGEVLEHHHDLALKAGRHVHCGRLHLLAELLITSRHLPKQAHQVRKGRGDLLREDGHCIVRP